MSDVAPQNDPEPDRTILSVTPQELAQTDLEAPIASSNKFECWSLAAQYQAASSATTEESGGATALVYGLIQGLCQLHFKPDDSAEPFGPFFVRADGQRTLIPSDIPVELNDALANLAPKLHNPVLRARVADVSWVNNRKLGACARIAITAYCECVALLSAHYLESSHEDADPTDFDVIQYLRRAAQIAVVTKGKQAFPRKLVEGIQRAREDAFSRAYLHGFIQAAKLDLDYEISSPADIATQAEHLFRSIPAYGDGFAAVALLEIGAAAFRDAKNADDEDRILIIAAECWAQVADSLKHSPMLEAHRLTQAIAMYGRVRGQKERRNQLRKRLIDVQSRMLDDFTPIGHSTDISGIVESVRSKVSGRTLGDSVRMLVLASRSPSPSSLRDDALESVKRSPLASTFGTDILDHGGKVKFRSPGIGGSETEREVGLRFQIIQNEDIRRGILYASTISTARIVINAEHNITADKLVRLMSASPFVPPAHAFIFAQGIARWFNGDSISGASILVPQLENSLRYVLTNAGEDVTTLKNDGTQEDRSITSLLESMRPALIRVFGQNIVFEIENLFLFRGGPALRHSIAHGQLPTGGFLAAETGYACWFILQLCCLPLLPHWSDIEASLNVS